MKKELKRQRLQTLARDIGRSDTAVLVLTKEDCCTDGKRIYVKDFEELGIIKGVPCSEAERWVALKALTAHEAAHVRFTDIKAAKGLTPLEMNITNALEDGRIERALEERFPGAKRWLEFANRYIIKHREIPKSPMSFIWALAVLATTGIIPDMPEEDRLFDDGCKPKDLVLKCVDLVEAAVTAPNTKEVVEIAKQIAAMSEVKDLFASVKVTSVPVPGTKNAEDAPVIKPGKIKRRFQALKKKASAETNAASDSGIEEKARTKETGRQPNKLTDKDDASEGLDGIGNTDEKSKEHPKASNENHENKVESDDRDIDDKVDPAGFENDVETAEPEGGTIELENSDSSEDPKDEPESLESFDSEDSDDFEASDCEEEDEENGLFDDGCKPKDFSNDFELDDVEDDEEPDESDFSDEKETEEKSEETNGLPDNGPDSVGKVIKVLGRSEEVEEDTEEDFEEDFEPDFEEAEYGEIEILAEAEEELKAFFLPKKLPVKPTLKETAQELAKRPGHEGIGFREINLDTPDNITKFKGRIENLARELANIIETKKTRYFPSKKGTLNPSHLYKIKTADPTVFRRKEVPDAVDIAAYILVDCSGSMFGPEIKDASQAACVIVRALMKAGIPVACAGFNTKNSKVVHIHAKRFEDSRTCCLSLYATGENRDGFSIRLAASELLKRPEQKKILFVLSDGVPSHVESPRNSEYSGKFAVRDTAEAIREAMRENIRVIGLYFGPDIVLNTYQMMYPHFVYAREAQNLEAILARKLKTLLEG